MESVDPAEAQHLPFWVTEIARRRVIVPAFRYRQLRHLHLLSRALSKNAPEWNRSDEKPRQLSGGFYDRDDARRLARFVHAGLLAEGGSKPEVPASDVGDPRLVWLPFRRQGNFLYDPFFRMNLFANLLG